MRPYSRLTSHQSKKFIERKNARLILTIGLSVFTIILWTYCFSILSYNQSLNINTINVVGTDSNTSALLEMTIRNSLDGSYLGLFSKSNIFIYPKQSLMRTIETLSPRVLSARVYSDGFQGLKIEVTEKIPSALICTSLPEFSDNELSLDSNISNCYFADWTGYLFDKALYGASTTLNRYYIPALANRATSSSSIIGVLSTSTSSFADLQEFYDGVRVAGMHPSAVLIKDGGEYEMYVGNIIIYFNNYRSLKEQLLNLVSFWDRMMRGKDRKTIFESIDVRYGSNVFYREIK